MSSRAVAWCLRGDNGRAPAIKGNRQVGQHYVWRVLLVLAEHTDKDGRDASPSQDLLALETGSERRDVRHALKCLLDQGLIEQIGESRRRVHGTVYALPAVANWSSHAVDNSPDNGGVSRPSCPVDIFSDNGGVSRPSSANKGGDKGGVSRRESIEPSSKPRAHAHARPCGRCEDIGWIETAGGMADRCPDCNTR